MAKPKAPRWLTESFAFGVDEQERAAPRSAAYVGAQAECWLSQHDPLRLRCSGRIERFHFVNRQRVEAIVWGALFEATVDESCEFCRGSGCNPANVLTACPGCDGARVWPRPLNRTETWEIIHAAGWDARNGGWGCEHHHRRLDGHATPALLIPITALPPRVIEFSQHYGTEAAISDRFPSP